MPSVGFEWCVRVLSKWRLPGAEIGLYLNNRLCMYVQKQEGHVAVP